MILSLSRTSLAFAGAFVAVASIGTQAGAGDVIARPASIQSSDRCALYGSGLVDLGNGMCGQSSGHGRVEVHSRNANTNAWTTNGTSNANLRLDGGAMVPGAIESQHLRIRGGLDGDSSFR